MQAAKGVTGYAYAAAAAGRRGLAHLVAATRPSQAAAAAASSPSNNGQRRPNSVIRPNSEKPGQESVVNLLRRLDRDPQKALRFLRGVAGRHGFQPDATTYNLVSSILGGEGDPVRDFWVGVRATATALGRIGLPLREIMARRDRGEMSIDMYLRLSRQLRRSGMVKRAARLNAFVMNTPGLMEKLTHAVPREDQKPFPHPLRRTTTG
ncbi:hypothetical protein Taro_020893 [Colocasia esculenta]|uniref:Pentatricopeptide repeat-containing protein n=1 Tax=Colocasia esculenta TaxID=4460 RepID=A0A843UXI9_COLES|nr:hypothetical protein [Colocasia esculenta]